MASPVRAPDESTLSHYAAITERLVRLLDARCAIIQDLAIEFYSKDVWSRLDCDWQRFLDSQGRHNVVQLLDKDASDFPESCPASLKAFFRACKEDSLQREVCTPRFARFDTPHLSTVFETGMKEKKVHEIEQLSGVVAAIMCGVDALVDVGGGKGHLAQVLQHYYNCHVINLECHSGHTEGARKRDVDLQFRLWSERQRELKRLGQVHLTQREYAPSETEDRHFDYFLSPMTNATHFVGELVGFLASSTHAGAAMQSAPTFGLLTLHGCGDLTPSVMRLFAESDAARALVCVGCCYQKVNLSLTPLLSFPMSQRVKTLLTECKSNDWYAGLLQTATESPRSFFHMKEKELKERERKLALRAIFEVALRESCQALSIVVGELSMGRLRPKSVFENVVDFGKAALDKASVRQGRTSVLLKKTVGEELFLTLQGATLRRMHELHTEHKEHFERLTAYLTLVNALADPCESLIVLDRFWFLHETGHVHVHIVPMFDPLCSPRNLAIVAVKKSTSNDF